MVMNYYLIAATVAIIAATVAIIAAHLAQRACSNAAVACKAAADACDFAMESISSARDSFRAETASISESTQACTLSRRSEPGTPYSFNDICRATPITPRDRNSDSVDGLTKAPNFRSLDP